MGPAGSHRGPTIGAALRERRVLVSLGMDGEVPSDVGMMLAQTGSMSAPRAAVSEGMLLSAFFGPYAVRFGDVRG